MKCLSIRQPWAAATLVGDKPVENRTWYCRHFGSLLIHAGKIYEKEGQICIYEDFYSTYEKIHAIKPLQLGAILGFVQMVDCVSHHDSDWFCGPYGFVFADPVMFDNPIPYKGQLGIFNVPYSVVRDQIEKAAKRIAQ